MVPWLLLALANSDDLLPVAPTVAETERNSFTLGIGG